MRKGFTLVELSIVLVIIGLLIGGILVAQSMMSAAVITNQVRQFQQFDIAVSNSNTQFGGLPGDNAVFPLGLAASTYGNKDGLVLCAACFISHNANEYCNFWPQLSRTNMLVDGHNYGYCDNSTPVIVPDGTVPAAKIDKNLGIFVSGISTENKNYYTMLNKANVSANIMGGASVSPSVLGALDAKMDDGFGNTGAVVSRAGGSSGDSNALTPGTGCFSASGKYAMSTSTVQCIPRIEMFSSIGNNNQ